MDPHYTLQYSYTSGNTVIEVTVETVGEPSFPGDGDLSYEGINPNPPPATQHVVVPRGLIAGPVSWVEIVP